MKKLDSQLSHLNIQSELGMHTTNYQIYLLQALKDNLSGGVYTTFNFTLFPWKIRDQREDLPGASFLAFNIIFRPLVAYRLMKNLGKWKGKLCLIQILD